MKLVLDIDGVLARFDPCFAKWVEDNHGHEPIPVLHWEWFHGYPEGQLLWDEFFLPENYNPAVLAAEPQPGASDGIQRLIKRGHDIAFATYRPEYALDVTADWLHVALGVNEPVVHHVKDKGTVPGDFYLDDHGQTVAALRANGLPAYVYDQPWNRWLESAPRVMSWPHVVHTVDDLEAVLHV